MRDLLVIAESAASVRSLRLALRQAPGLCVVGTVDGRAPARPALTRLQPEIVLVDDSCQRANLMARIREARVWAPGAEVVLLSSGAQAAVLDDAFACGAHLALDRRLPPLTLAVLLEEIARGSVRVPRPPARERVAATGARRPLRIVRGQDAAAGTTA